MADTTQMNPEEMQAFYKRLSELTKQGSEAEVRAYINDHYLHLPEEVRDEILFSLMRSSVDEQLLEDKTIDEVQTQGLAAADVLEDLKKEVEKEQQA